MYSSSLRSSRKSKVSRSLVRNVINKKLTNFCIKAPFLELTAELYFSWDKIRNSQRLLFSPLFDQNCKKFLYRFSVAFENPIMTKFLLSQLNFTRMSNQKKNYFWTLSVLEYVEFLFTFNFLHFIILYDGCVSNY